ncbi:MAG: hypothetical protein MJZ41_10200 [Bacteroidaceae bacterium]|nr:hypothetical protein [Bacteroidaceae bacterium]
MLFESKGKADNFIKFNAGEILKENDKAPVRSYYCTLCIGWHVTSNPSTVEGERLDGRDENLIHKISLYKQNKEDVSIISQRINVKLQEFEMYLHMGGGDKAEDTLDICGFDIEDAQSFTMVIDKVGRLQERVGKARERLEKYIMLNDMGKEEQDKLLNNPDPTKNVTVRIPGKSLSTFIFIKDNEETVIEKVDESAKGPVTYYDLQGRRIAKPQGLYIEKYADGTYKKIYSGNNE